MLRPGQRGVTPGKAETTNQQKKKPNSAVSFVISGADSKAPHECCYGLPFQRPGNSRKNGHKEMMYAQERESATQRTPTKSDSAYSLVRFKHLNYERSFK